MLQVALRGIVSWVPGIFAENVAMQDPTSQACWQDLLYPEASNEDGILIASLEL